MLKLVRDVGGTYVPRLIAPAFDSMQWRLPKPAAGQASSRVAALTFDDGPTPEGTPRLLDVLAEFNVPATHFVLGEQAERHPELIKSMLNAGHEVGNHSWSHIDCWKAAMPALVREFRRTDRLLADLTGQPVRFVRPPFGKFTYPLIHWARRRSQRVVLWDTMPPDYSERADVAYIGRVLGRLRERSIVCLHDNDHSRQFTPAALRETLPRLLDQGWKFVRLETADH